MVRKTYCDDILHQISAAQKALESVSRVLLESHIKYLCHTSLKARGSYDSRRVPKDRIQNYKINFKTPLVYPTMV